MRMTCDGEWMESGVYDMQIGVCDKEQNFVRVHKRMSCADEPEIDTSRDIVKTWFH